METIKKIGAGLLVVGGVMIAVSWITVQLTPIGTLVANAVQIMPEPRVTNPIPRCSECLEQRGLSPVCLNVCIQEVVFPVSKPTLEFLAGQ
jgi:hypothetical protein